MLFPLSLVVLPRSRNAPQLASTGPLRRHSPIRLQYLGPRPRIATSMLRQTAFLPLLLALSFSSHAQDAAPAAPTASQSTLSKSFTLDGSKVWLDTGLTLEPGQRFTASASGTLRYADAKADNGPDGLSRGFKDLIRILPLNAAGRGALI